MGKSNKKQSSQPEPSSSSGESFVNLPSSQPCLPEASWPKQSSIQEQSGICGPRQIQKTNSLTFWAKTVGFSVYVVLGIKFPMPRRIPLPPPIVTECIIDAAQAATVPGQDESGSPSASSVVSSSSSDSTSTEETRSEATSVGTNEIHMQSDPTPAEANFTSVRQYPNVPAYQASQVLNKFNPVHRLQRCRWHWETKSFPVAFNDQPRTYCVVDRSGRELFFRDSTCEYGFSDINGEVEGRIQAPEVYHEQVQRTLGRQNKIPASVFNPEVDHQPHVITMRQYVYNTRSEADRSTSALYTLSMWDQEVAEPVGDNKMLMLRMMNHRKAVDLKAHPLILDLDEYVVRKKFVGICRVSCDLDYGIAEINRYNSQRNGALKHLGQPLIDSGTVERGALRHHFSVQGCYYHNKNFAKAQSRYDEMYTIAQSSQDQLLVTRDPKLHTWVSLRRFPNLLSERGNPVNLQPDRFTGDNGAFEQSVMAQIFQDANSYQATSAYHDEVARKINLENGLASIAPGAELDPGTYPISSFDHSLTYPVLGEYISNKYPGLVQRYPDLIDRIPAELELEENNLRTAIDIAIAEGEGGIQ